MKDWETSWDLGQAQAHKDFVRLSPRQWLRNTIDEEVDIPKDVNEAGWLEGYMSTAEKLSKEWAYQWAKAAVKAESVHPLDLPNEIHPGAEDGAYAPLSMLKAAWEAAVLHAQKVVSPYGICKECGHRDALLGGRCLDCAVVEAAFEALDIEQAPTIAAAADALRNIEWVDMLERFVRRIDERAEDLAAEWFEARSKDE